jgi:UbiD family decarboxylase
MSDKKNASSQKHCWPDVREYISALEQDDLFRWVDREVDKDWEIGSVVRLLFRGIAEEKRFAVGFSNIHGFSGGRVAVGLIGASKRILAKILGVEPEIAAVHSRWSEALAQPIAPRMVSTGPCKENIFIGDKVDLLKLPVPIWIPEKDAGPLFTPLWITKDPTMRVRNVGMYRAELKGKNQTGIQWGTPSSQHAAQHLQHWETLDKPMPAAFVIGGDPSTYLPAVTKVPYGVDEFAVAGAVKGEPVDLVKCETVDLEVPASSEIVIEGQFLPGVREHEGPFGEFTGFMAGSAASGEPVFNVKCVTHRNNPILQGMLSQMPPSESSCCRQMLMEGAILHHLTQELRFPGILDAHLPESGGGGAWLWIRARKAHNSYPYQVAMSVWSKFGFQHYKWIVVTDEDVNIRNSFAREWTLAFRVRPEEDVHITPKVIAMTLDPSATMDPRIASRDRTAAKIFIDATKKYADFPEVAMPPIEHLERVAEKWLEYGLGDLSPEWKAILT